MALSTFKARMLEAFRFRMYFFSVVIGLTFVIIILQLFNLQFIQGKEYKLKARMNMENNIPIPASRGEIYDRNYAFNRKNAVIVSSRASFNITTIPAKFKSKKKLNRTIDNLSKLLKLQKDDLLMEISDKNPWERIIIKEDVDFDCVVKIASNPNFFPHIDWEDAPVRIYNFSEIFAHAVGYIGSIDKDEYKLLKKQGYRYYQKIGKSGIEKEYDKLLRGADGFVRRVVDVRNRTGIEEIGLNPVSGNNIVLSIDYEIQKTAFEAIKDQMGSVIVLKPSTGEVLALLSTPDFDPNKIISKENDKIVRDLMEDKNKPFLNRVIQSKYPPASTFKLVTAIAALESEKATPDQRYYCSGKYTLKGYIDRDFYDYEMHEWSDLRRAIAKSCSVYFYQLGYKVGPATILKYANYFGLNEKTGVDLPGEIAGFIPSEKWKLKTFGQPWFDGDTLNLAIGQGFISVTPIEMANFLAAVVNNGIVYRPHVVKEIRSPDNRTLIQSIPIEKIREMPLSPLAVNTVKEAMRFSVTGGTSGRLAVLNVQAAGKTGTAQTRSVRQDKTTQHAWFIGYAPFDGPPEKAVIVIVMIEYGVAGSASAVPIAESIFARMSSAGYFTKDAEK